MKQHGIKIKPCWVILKCEKYEDFFYRKHGFKHTEQSRQAREQNEYIYVTLRSEVNNIIKKVNNIELTLSNIQNELVKKVKGYKVS